MKLKKVLLFILIFFFCLLIKNNVNAYVVNEGGQGKYYLKDLPFSEEEYDTVFIYNETDNTVFCIGVQKFCSLGFDASNKCFYQVNDVNYEFDLLHVYTCSLDTLDGLLVGSEWNYYSISSGNRLKLDNYLSYKYIGGSVPIYICSDNYIIKNLPDIEGLSWNSHFFIYKSSDGNYVAKLIVPKIPKSNYFFTTYNSLNPNLVQYVPDFNSSWTKDCFNVYGYNISTNIWDFLKTSDVFRVDNALYLPFDVYKNYDDNGVIHFKNNYIFSALFTYSNFPYILNGQEDLAKGEEDIIIMPRRF